MKKTFFYVSILFFSISVVFFHGCKSSDDDSGYVPINIVANADSGEVFQNAVLEIAVLQNDTNVPVEGEIILTNPLKGTVVLNTNGTPTEILDDFVIYTPEETATGEDTFEYTVCDASGQSCATGTVTINVLPFTPVNFDIASVPYPTLSEYNFFEGDLANHEPVYGVLPYDLITPLFTDYAHKKRFVWMPYGVKAQYDGDGNILNFPTGAILIKTFYYENVLPGNTTQIIETRLLIKKAEGWIFADYIWNEEQNEAFLDTTGDGGFKEIEWVENGETKFVNYRIPSQSQCFTCHKNYKAESPIGPKPQNLNRNYTYPEGAKNQLDKWIEMGYLESVPSTIATVVNWQDVSNSLALRVRSYLDINCSNCHSESGHCDYRPLRFAFSETEDPVNLGICVTPDTPIPGYEGSKVIIPGDAENSILFFRFNTNNEEYRMPLLGRTIQHQEALALIEEWINTLTETCD
ncbi:MAG: Ig-like domain-containing protein [Flavobacteriaceae bacterium]